MGAVYRKAAQERVKPLHAVACASFDLFDNPDVDQPRGADPHLDRIKQQAKNHLRLAMRRTNTLGFYQSIALAWPIVILMLLRFTAFAGKDLPNLGQPHGTWLENTLQSIVHSMGQQSGVVYHSTIRASSNEALVRCTRTLLVNAMRVIDYSVVPKAPPFTKHLGGEDVQTLVWQWWRKDYMIFAYSLKFGADAEKALEPKLPAADRPPLRTPATPSAEAIFLAVAESLELPDWARVHLLPRLLSDHDASVLQAALYPAASAPLELM